MIILDSDIIIEIYDKQSKAGDLALGRIEGSGDTFGTSVINLQEVLYGRLKYSKNIDYIIQLPIIDYRKDDARLAAELEWKTELKGRKIDRADAIVAAISINNGARLYTNNKKHFAGVEGLELF